MQNSFANQRILVETDSGGDPCRGGFDSKKVMKLVRPDRSDHVSLWIHPCIEIRMMETSLLPQWCTLPDETKKLYMWPEIRASLPNNTCKMRGPVGQVQALQPFPLLQIKATPYDWIEHDSPVCQVMCYRTCCPEWLKHVQQPSTNRSSPVKDSTWFKLHVDAVVPSKLQNLLGPPFQLPSCKTSRGSDDSASAIWDHLSLWRLDDQSEWDNQLSVQNPGIPLYCLVYRDSPFLDYDIIINRYKL